MTDGQGIAWDITFCDLDRDVARVGTWHHKGWDMKACQDPDEDREARN
jgi:hypothetical protein